MNKELFVFFDMDGTIVSFHDRFYKIYRDAFLKSNCVPLSKEKWIEMRRKGLHHTPEEHEVLNPYFEKYFECSEYLCQDKMFPGIKNVIQHLQNKYVIKIVSFRANGETLLEQLSNLGINNVEIIIQGYNPNALSDEKARMIQKVIPNPKGWIIGDTHYEILAGKKLGLKTIAVTYGDQSVETLQKYNPDFIVNKPKEILNIIQ